MLRVGIVGLGFMGRMHYRCWKGLSGASVTAVCEANPNVLAAAGQPGGGNVDGAADHVDLEGVAVFSDLDEMLKSGTVDAISLTLPTFLHPDFTIRALQAGVHVLCEKPMALTVEDCDRMIAASKETDKVLQIGHCIRFWPEYVATRDLIKSGQFGNVISASFRRFSALPTWSPDNWFADESRSGAQPLDLHIHDADYVHYLFGIPDSVTSVADGSQSYISTQYHYAAGPAVVAEGTWRMSLSFGFEMSFVIVLERGVIVLDSTRSPSFRVCPAEGAAFTPIVPPGDGYTREIEHFAQLARGEKVESVVTAQESRDTVRIVLAEKRSARENHPIFLN